MKDYFRTSFILKFISVALLVCGFVLSLIESHLMHSRPTHFTRYAVSFGNVSFFLMVFSVLCAVSAALKAKQPAWLLIAVIAFAQIAYSLLKAIR